VFRYEFACYSWWFPPPRRLGAARIVERRLVIVSGSDRGDCEGFLSLSRGRSRKASLVDCSWLVWSLSCVGCAAPGCRFSLWCQLACEPLSGWIATTRTSLLASKWTSVKNHYIIFVRGFHWLSCDWLIGFIILWLAYTSTRWYNHRHPL
jgi:hypothetical protein